MLCGHDNSPLNPSINIVLFGSLSTISFNAPCARPNCLRSATHFAEAETSHQHWPSTTPPDVHFRRDCVRNVCTLSGARSRRAQTAALIISRGPCRQSSPILHLDLPVKMLITDRSEALVQKSTEMTQHMGFQCSFCLPLSMRIVGCAVAGKIPKDCSRRCTSFYEYRDCIRLIRHCSASSLSKC
jgi:hypothetical protein